MDPAETPLYAEPPKQTDYSEPPKIVGPNAPGVHPSEPKDQISGMLMLGAILGWPAAFVASVSLTASMEPRPSPEFAGWMTFGLCMIPLALQYYASRQMFVRNGMSPYWAWTVIFPPINLFLASYATRPKKDPAPVTVIESPTNYPRQTDEKELS